MIREDGKRVECDREGCANTISVDSWPGRGKFSWWRLEDGDLYDFCSIGCVGLWANGRPREEVHSG